MKLGLEKKRVLVTGGSRGIGKAIANAFLSEGANTYITARNLEDLKSTQEHLKRLYGINRIFARQSDASKNSDIISLHKEIIDLWNGLDILILNVGNGKGSGDPLPGKNIWDYSWDINFNSARSTAKIFLPNLKHSKGCILFVSSIAGLEMVNAPTEYSVAKSALIALAKNMASKFGGDIRVNVVAPGNILFDGGVWDKKITMDPNGVKDMLKLKVPLKRFGLPEEVADAVIFLCSDKASFITGSVLVIDGGQTNSLS